MPTYGPFPQYETWRYEKNLTSDSYIKKLATEQNISSDSYIKVLATENNINSDSSVARLGVPVNLTSDSYILKLATEKNLLSDSFILKLENSNSIDSDSWIAEPKSENIGSDSYILTTYEVNLVSNSNIFKIYDENIGSDSTITRLGVTNNISSDTYILETKTISFLGVVDSYSESNQSNYWVNSPEISFGQSFTGDGTTLDKAVFYLRKFGSPTGTATAKIYAHTGTFGTNGTPTGSSLATSETIDVSSLTTSFVLTDFLFTGANRIVLDDGTKYVVVISRPDPGYPTNYMAIGIDASSPTHGGNTSSSEDDSSWASYSAYDSIFYIYGSLSQLHSDSYILGTGANNIGSDSQITGVPANNISSDSYILKLGYENSIVSDSWILETKSSQEISLEDSYSTGSTSGYVVNGSTTPVVGQSFTASFSGSLTSAKFVVAKFSGSPTGSCYAKLYSHSGTYGTSSVGNTLLATSDAYDVSTIPGTRGQIELTFSGANQVVLIKDSYYVIVFEYGGGGGNLFCYVEVFGAHSGNECTYVSSWTAHSNFDTLFEVYAESGLASDSWIVIPISQNIVSDSSIFATSSENILSNSEVTILGTKNLLSDSFIKKLDNEENITSSSWIDKEVANNLTSNSYILQTSDNNLISDSFIFKLGYENSIVSDSFILDTLESNLDTLSFIFDTYTKNIESSSYIARIESGNIVSDSELVGPVEGERNLTSLSYILKLDSIVNIGSDSWLAKEFANNLTSDSIILQASDSSFITDSYILQESENNLLLDSFIKYTTTVGEVDFSNGLIAHWKFDDDATDELGTYDGTVGGSPTYEIGKINKAIAFSGAETVNLPSTIGAKMHHDQDFTIAFWVKRRLNWESAWQTIFGAYGSSTDRVQIDSYGPQTTDYAAIRCRIDTSLETNRTMNAVNISDDEWHHCVFTYTASTHNYEFINDNVTGNNITLTGTIDLSGGWYKIVSGAKVLMDDVRFYDRVLTTNEITKVYLAGVNSFISNSSIKVLATENNLTSDSYVLKLGVSSNILSNSIIKKLDNVGDITSTLFVSKVTESNLVSDSFIKDTTLVGDVDFSNGLISHWKLDENPAIHNTAISDSVGSNHGTFNTGDGSTNKSVPGKVSRGIDLAVNDRINCGTDSSLRTSTYSVGCWVYNIERSGLAGAAVSSDKWTSTDPSNGFKEGFVIRRYNSDTDWQLIQGAALNLGNSIATSVPLRTWTHLMMTYDGTTLTGYKNGVYVNSIVCNFTVSTRNFYIGYSVTNTAYHDGIVDDVRYYNRALSASEINQLYFAGINSFVSDSSILTTYEPNLTSDSYIQKLGYEDSFTSNSSVKKLDNDSNMLSSSNIAKIDNTENITSDSFIKYTTTVGELDSTTGQLSHWKLDDDVTDAEGINNGTVVGTFSYTEGKVNKAGVFTGGAPTATGYVNCGNSDDFNINNDRNRSISFWFKCPGNYNEGEQNYQWPRVLAKGTWAANGFSLEINQSDYGIVIRYANAVGWEGNLGTMYYTPNTWELFTWVTDSAGNWTTYKNGVYVGTGVAPTYTSNTMNFMLGASSWGSGRFIGNLDDVRFYTSALTVNEIEKIYLAGVNSFISDSYIKTTYAQSILSDSTVLVSDIEGSITSNSQITKLGTTNNILSTSFLFAPSQSNLTSNSWIAEEKQASLLSSSIIFRMIESDMSCDYTIARESDAIESFMRLNDLPLTVPKMRTVRD